MMRMTDMVKHLLIINIIFFVGSFLAPQAQELLALHYFENDRFRIWQPLTHMFMHGGIGHIFFNMFALVMFGSTLEHFWGGKKFLFFYISCGLGAMLLHTAVNYYSVHEGVSILIENGFSKQEIYSLLNEEKYNLQWQEFLSPTVFQNMTQGFIGVAVGASGAIYGLLVAYAFMFPNAELMLIFLPVPIKAKYFVPGLLLMDLYLGLNGNPILGGSTGIAHFAHIGGAIIGFVMMWYWKKNQFDRNRWDR
ncbi:rhomboid family intramembrane serine protease [Flavobacterium okayamense]|uniref:Rhomboid family intramembrane serine protease n=1 Tax=Flavobacterium okayamense TaxID=2830782 RepID=A0ABM7S4M8_9FLAO|nr:rhomboid family intramembrane serine protease [Flavobacterium okayamense]BCY28477.1 rhomboid family intramembrane serine protease [Flavobacterium okayamense]